MEYVVLFRGINVGGRNKVPMAGLRAHLERDFDDVRTYIQSGNVLLRSDASAAEVAGRIEQSLPGAFALDSDLIRVLALDAVTYRGIVAEAPEGFGDEPETYRYDVGFYLGLDRADVAERVRANPEVDVNTFGSQAFYHRRLSAQASRSWLTRIVGTPLYASLTIRNWRTTTTLAQMLSSQHPPLS